MPELGAKHESPGPKGIAPLRKGTAKAVHGSRPELRVGTDADSRAQDCEHAPGGEEKTLVVGLTVQGVRGKWKGSGRSSS